jgi:hypothetical protein
MRSEWLRDGHEWLRVADPSWGDPLDPAFAQERGGRWNPPDSFETLYLNEDVATARLNLGAFIAAWPYEPEDLRNDNGPVLVAATLPRRQRVADLHSPAGVAAAGLPASYPVDDRGHEVPREVCQPVGGKVKREGLRGIRCRSVHSPAGRELAWFPASSHSRARRTDTFLYGDWYWA